MITETGRQLLLVIETTQYELNAKCLADQARVADESRARLDAWAKDEIAHLLSSVRECLLLGWKHLPILSLSSNAVTVGDCKKIDALGRQLGIENLGQHVVVFNFGSDDFRCSRDFRAVLTIDRVKALLNT